MVIGGGSMGASTLYHLAKRGVKAVCLTHLPYCFPSYGHAAIYGLSLGAESMRIRPLQGVGSVCDDSRSEKCQVTLVAPPCDRFWWRRTSSPQAPHGTAPGMSARISDTKLIAHARRTSLGLVFPCARGFAFKIPMVTVTGRLQGITCIFNLSSRIALHAGWCGGCGPATWTLRS